MQIKAISTSKKAENADYILHMNRVAKRGAGGDKLPQVLKVQGASEHSILQGLGGPYEANQQQFSKANFLP